jgi:pimeloyl-ACP methyl ester carboxylesterase
MPRQPPDVFSDHGGQFPWKSRLLDVGAGVKQACVDEGPRDARLTFLCAHGNPTWGFLYRAFIAALSGEHRVLAPDHVGFGRSDKPTDIGYYTLERHIANLSLVLDACSARKVIPIVQDWGGPIALGWATRHPDRIAGVVILNTWAFVREPPLKLPFLFKLLVRGAGGYRRVTEKNFFVETLLGRLGTVRRLPETVLDAYRAPHPRPQDRMGIAAFPRMIPETRDLRHPEWSTMSAIEDGLARLADVPALIVWATKDQAFKRPQLYRWKGLFRRADGPHFVRAGHFLQEDAPDEILNRIRAWLPPVAASG